MEPPTQEEAPEPVASEVDVEPAPAGEARPETPLQPPADELSEEAPREARPPRFPLWRRKEKDRSSLRKAMEDAVELSFSVLPEADVAEEAPAAESAETAVFTEPIPTRLFVVSKYT